MQRIHVEDHPLSSSWHTNNQTLHTANSTDNCNDDSDHDRGSGNTHNEPSNQQSNMVPERTNRFISATTSSDSETRSPAASLIQSAARSILDNETATPSTIVSDDASENFSCADGTLGKRNTRRGHFAPSLNSLQIETLPAIPDEQDRKRFVGCLAAVLASSYDYDENDEGATPEEIARDPYYYVDMEDDSFDESEDYLRSESVETHKYDQNKSDDMISGRRIRPSSCRHFYRQHRSESVSTTSMWRTNSQPNKHVVAARRHRQRRYDVLSRLLISSSELLLLEKGVAKAFLPMLAPVLVPQPNRDFPVAPESNDHDDDNQDLRLRYLPRNIDEDDVLRPFLESLCTCAG